MTSYLVMFLKERKKEKEIKQKKLAAKYFSWEWWELITTTGWLSVTNLKWHSRHHKVAEWLEMLVIVDSAQLYKLWSCCILLFSGGGCTAVEQEVMGSNQGQNFFLFSLVFYLHILVENLVLLYPLSDLCGYVKFFKVWLSEDLNLVDLFYIVHSLSCHHSWRWEEQMCLLS